MHRVSPPALAITLTVLLLGGAAAEAQPSDCSSGGILCGGVATPPGGGGGASGPPSGSGGSPPSPVDPDAPVRHYSLDTRVEDGTPCWYVTSRLAPPPVPAGSTYAAVVDQLRDFNSNGVVYAACPSSVREVVGDPAQYLSAGDLPVAHGTIEPGEALTGLRTYLVVERRSPGTWPPPAVSTPLGTLQVGADLVHHTVAWDDGPTSTRTATSDGVPHPGGPGEISWVYRDRGVRTVAVSSTYGGWWRLGGASGRLGTYTVDGPDITLPVTEVQAVRER